MRNWLICAALLGGAAMSASAGVLLVADSGNDTVWALDPMDGSVINNALIADATRFGTPTTAIDSGRGSIFVSDQITDGVYEYDYAGNYLGTFADSAQGLDNVRGITVHNNQLYVTVAGGALSGTVQRFDMDGSNQTTWASGIGSPWWVQFRGNDVLVSDSGDDNVERFDVNGNPLGALVDGDGVTSIDFPREIYELPNGNLLVGGFSPPSGIYEYDSNGNQVGNYATAFGVRGVWLLGNGKYLFTSGTIMGTYDPMSGLTEELMNLSGASFQHISFSALPEPTSLALLAIGALAAIRRR